MSHESCTLVTNYPRYSTPGRVYTRCFRNAEWLVFMNHTLHVWVPKNTYESQISCMSHELHLWVTNYPRYTTPGRMYTRCFHNAAALLFMSHALHTWVQKNMYIWVTNHMYESRMMYMSDRLSTIYNTRKDIHEVLPPRSRSVLQCVAVCCSVLFISHTLHVWMPHYTYESRTTRMSRELCVRFKNHIYESRMMHNSHELSTIYNNARKDVHESLLQHGSNAVHEPCTTYMCA